MKWHDEWKGTTAEINDTIEFYLNEIMNEYNVDRKTAKKYLCEQQRVLQCLSIHRTHGPFIQGETSFLCWRKVGRMPPPHEGAAP